MVMIRCVLIAIGLFTAMASPASALITGGRDEPIKVQGLPEGALPLANLKTRIAWWEGPPFGGGQYHFEYSGKTADLQAAIDLFAHIDSPRKQLIVRSGVQNSFWLNATDKNKSHPIDWQFMVWVPRNWQHLRDSKMGLLPPGEEGEAPKTELVVYVSDRIEWQSLMIPPALSVVDERLESNGLTADQGAALQGRVRDPDGRPIAAATITIGKDADRITATSDAEGTFLATRIPAGTHRVVVSAPGFASKDKYYHSFTETTFKKLDVALAKAAEVRVRAVDGQGKPIPDVVVRVRNCIDRSGNFYRVAGEHEYKTDSAGEFVVTDVPHGKLKFISRTQDYFYNSVLNEHDTGESPIVLKLLPTGTVTVSVATAGGQAVTSKYIVEIDQADADRGDGSKVGSWGGSANIAADGSYTFKNIPPGDYVVTGKPNPGRESDRTDPTKVQIKGKDHHDVNLTAK
ncbi:Cna protein B-type domain protein [Stieleria maiorica]|uniref:Cna protein B-type domain protein n=1 Tax=Stieleria maiorica TaxID=2795974 RepID=A0A5B9MKQ5_9BACT|nr:carboxypeptidase-like regulatory domain-containing protein [Stieleria maiorica]QEG00601.1 Cna protein B-type domain protein [Stieleria maiorica]